MHKINGIFWRFYFYYQSAKILLFTTVRELLTMENTKKIFFNKTINIILGSSLFESLGVSLFNIILLTYAKGFTNPNLLISVVSVATVLPAALGIFLGRIADSTKNKGYALCIVKFIQAITYLLIGGMISKTNIVFFYLIVIFNLFSDALGEYSYSLKAPLIQKAVSKDLQEQVLGINQSITILLTPLGQALGVLIISISGNYQLASWINSLTFFIAGIILFIGQKNLNFHINTLKQDENFISLVKKSKHILEDISQISFKTLILSLILLNGIGTGIDGILNLFILNHSQSIPLSFSSAILILNIVFVVGSIAGNVLPIKPLQKLSLQALISIIILEMIVMFFSLLLQQNYWTILALMFVIAFSLGKLNPKFSALIMNNTPAEYIGSIFGIIESIITVSSPLGSIFLVTCYNIFSEQFTFFVAILILSISFFVLIRKRIF